MAWTEDQLVQIVSSGGGIIIDSENWTINELKHIASSAQNREPQSY